MNGRVIAAGLVLVAAWFAYAAKMTGAQPPVKAGAIAVTAIDAVSQVLKTNKKLRTVTIKDPAGKKVTIDVPPELALDQMKKGSLLDVRYVEAEAVAIGKPGVPHAAAAATVTLAPKDGMPAEMTAVTKRVTGMVKDIDRMKRELTVTGPGKRDITLRVAADVPGFDQTKIGDRAAVQYTSAIAISAVRHAGNAKESSQ